MADHFSRFTNLFAISGLLLLQLAIAATPTGIFDTPIWITGSVITVAIFGAIILYAEFLGKYGKPPQKEKPQKSRKSNDIVAGLGTALYLIVMVVVAFVFAFATTGNHLSYMWITIGGQGVLTVASFVAWFRSSNRRVWWYDPLFNSLLLLWTFWLGYTTQFKQPETVLKLTPIIYLNFLLYALVFLMVLVQTIQQVKKDRFNQNFLQEDGTVAFPIVQIILTAVEAGGSISSRLIQQLTGLNQEDTLQVLMNLESNNLLTTKQVLSPSKPVQFMVFLTPTGTSMAKALKAQWDWKADKIRVSQKEA